MASITLGTYNILVPRPQTKEKTHSWDNRKREVVSTIVNNFDIVGLQEVDTNPAYQQSFYMLEEMVKHGWEAYMPGVTHKTEHDSTTQFHSRVPIFWNPQILHPLSLHSILLSNAYPSEEKETPIVENRYCSYGLFETYNGKTLFFATHHLQHGFDHGIAEQVMAARKQADALKILGNLAETMNDHPVVIAGDFNNTNPWSLLDVNYGLQNSFDVASEVSEQKFNSFHNWQNPLLLDSSHIDHVFVNDKVQVEKAAVILSKASDHYPIQVTVKI